MDRIAAARRALPRTGISNIDEEALLLFSCLSRIEVAVSKSLAEQRDKRTQTVAGANGERIDVTNRTSFGRPLPEDPTQVENDVESFVFKSDASVASASLVRLAQHASRALKEMARMTAENAALQQKLAESEAAVATLTERLHRAEDVLRQVDDPQQIYSVYKKTWKKQHEVGQAAIAASHDGKERALEAFLNKRAGASEKASSVSAFKLLYHTSEELLRSEFKNDEADIASLIAMFSMPESDITKAENERGKKKKGGGKEKDIAAKIALLSGGSISGLQLSSLGSPQLQLKASGSPLAGSPQLFAGGDDDPRMNGGTPDNLSDLGDDDFGDGGAATGKSGSLMDRVDTSKLVPLSDEARSAAELQAKSFIAQLHHVDLPRAQRLRLEDLQADTDVLSMDSVQKTAAADLRRAKTRAVQSVKSAALVVTYYLNSNRRKISKLDDAGTLMYQLRNVLTEAPTTYSNLVIDAPSMVGKSEVLTEQAAKVGLSTVWAEITLYDQPVVRVMALEGPTGGVASLQREVERDAHITDIPDPASPSITAVDESKARMLKLKFFRGAPNENIQSFWTSTHGGSGYRQRTDVQTVVTDKQHPGILRFIATDFGRCPTQWISPIQRNQVRCYASSMVDTCKPDALIAPFEDRRVPFFMTEDQALQEVIISFAKAVIIPSGYSISSIHPITGGLYPRNWKLEGSLDMRHWSLLREHHDDETLNRYNPTYYWDLPRVQRGEPYFQHFRLTQLRPNACGTNNFCVSAFEVYGRLMFVEKLTSEPASAVPKLKVARVNYPTFSALPPPRAVEVAKKKK